MNIQPTHQIAKVHYAPARRATPAGDTTAATDQVQTSKEFQLLAQNLPKLREQLAPRPDILAKFSGFTEQSFDPDDETIDKILTAI